MYFILERKRKRREMLVEMSERRVKDRQGWEEAGSARAERIRQLFTKKIQHEKADAKNGSYRKRRGRKNSKAADRKGLLCEHNISFLHATV
jgi:hypothetical protein